MRSRWVTLPVHYYVEIFRCTPLLVQIVWFYYALPIVLQVELPDWFAAGLGLTLYMGAFATEIFRGGIISIDKGQWQASRALGMTGGELMRHIILPQADQAHGAAVRQPVDHPAQEHLAALRRGGARPHVHGLDHRLRHLPAARGLYQRRASPISSSSIRSPCGRRAWRRALTSSGEVMVKVEGLRKSYGTVEAVRGVSLEVERGQVVVVIGPSGCGKSTFLRCINLLEEPSAGTLQVGDRAHRLRRRSIPCRAAATWRASAPASAWCSSSSTSSRT